jgi:hypothetical protein
MPSQRTIDLCSRISTEKHSEKLHAMVEELITVLAEEQDGKRRTIKERNRCGESESENPSGIQD